MKAERAAGYTLINHIMGVTRLYCKEIHLLGGITRLALMDITPALLNIMAGIIQTGTTITGITATSEHKSNGQKVKRK
jgi:hypothetical protein